MPFNCLSATKSRQAQAGFTLIEVMVVVLIIGIIVSFASLSIGQRSDPQQEEEAKRLAALMRLAADDAIINSGNMWLEFYKGSYRFGRFTLDPRDLKMKPVALDKKEEIFKPRELPPHLQLRVELAGQEVVLGLKPEDGKETPSAYFYNSGEMTPFVIDVEDEDGNAYRLQGDFNGEIKVTGLVTHG